MSDAPQHEPAELVHLEVTDGVATITLDSPPNRNALSARLRRELLAHLDATEADEAVRVVLLTHTGTVFCSGMDLRETAGAGADEQGVNEFPQVLTRLLRHRCPVIAVLRGPARAGGVGLVAACDIAVAARGATFAFSEVRIGVVPAVISVPLLPLLDPRAAQELFLTGDVFDTDRAVAIGLLTATADPEELDALVARYTASLGRGGPTALAATKAMLAARATAGSEARFAEMLELSAGFFAADEAQEGMRAFAEKRPAAWVPAPPADPA